jgi:hypothetical protein
MLIATVRAAIGPAADPVADGVPLTVTHAPATTSFAVADTVCENVVDDVNDTVVEPENWFDTLIDEPDTDATEPEAIGRSFGGAVVDVEEPEDASLEPEVLPHAAARMPRAPMSTVHRRALQRDRRCPGDEPRSRMAPPALIPRAHLHHTGARDLGGEPGQPDSCALAIRLPVLLSIC